MQEVGEQDAQSNQHHCESIDNDAFLSPRGVVSTVRDGERKKRERKWSIRKDGDRRDKKGGGNLPVRT